MEQFLRERGLSLSPEKTVVTNVEEGFDFLGLTVRRQNNKLLTKPAKKSVKRFLRRVREVIRRLAHAPAGVLVRVLNRMIRGWANYHRHGASSRTFGFVDHAIWQALWRWAVRRHAMRPGRWVKNKYFPTRQGRSWNFTGSIARADGTKETVVLIKWPTSPSAGTSWSKGRPIPSTHSGRSTTACGVYVEPARPSTTGSTWPHHLCSMCVATSPATGADREA